ncbi:MAG: PRC-barrel domain-containing protein [Proteobacteria bacterium]|nr:PRC-barrel domain-containing protein [Pseudomonadota bacterium]
MIDRKLQALAGCAAAAGLALAMALPAAAQTGAAAPVAGAVRLGVAVAEMDVVAKGWSAKKSVLGHNVVNDEGKKIASVEDLIVAPDQKVSFAILDVGGFLGMGERRVAVPVEQLKPGPKGSFLLPGATKDALKQLPHFVYAKAH